MFRPIRTKICGLTREADVDLALSLGADYCGFIVYEKSPRGLTLDRAATLAARVPRGKRVLVDVNTGTDDLERYLEKDFDFFQIHSGANIAMVNLAAWSGMLGKDRLWLAPQFAPEDGFPALVLEFARTIVVDTFRKDQIGGTGETGDWRGFADLKILHPESHFILAGGLNPENILSAIGATGAEMVDVNSGVESAPGQKDSSKLNRLFRKLSQQGH